MFCENLQYKLPLYADDILTAEERCALDEHLAQCPLCRQKFDDFHNLRNDLRGLARPEFSAQMLNRVRTSVAGQLQTSGTNPVFLFPAKSQNWIQRFFIPYSIGTFAALIIGFSFFWAMFISLPETRQNEVVVNERIGEGSTILMTRKVPSENGSATSAGVSDSASAMSISDTMLTVNKSGKLIEMTESFANDKNTEEEVVVIADVFSNGQAEVAEVVEPINDWKTVDELDRALKEDSNFAPFVPAIADHRSEIVRVIFKIQLVEVNVRDIGRY